MSRVDEQPKSLDLARLAAVFAHLRTNSITLGLAVATAIFGAVVLGVSYLDEDAFISFRVVDNFVRGFGLRWNVDERVQVYTHPLWVLCLIPLRALFSNIRAASYVLSWLLSVGAFALIAHRLAISRRVLFIAFLFPLLLSQSFVDYTSSGLENPLLFLFLALFVRRLELLTLGRASWLAAWMALARPDTILMVLPLVAGLAVYELRRNSGWRVGGWRVVKAGLVGGAPLWCWFAFSLFYYGFLWPNPRYAKLGGEVGLATYLKFGATYLLDIARNDTVTFGVLALGIAMAGYGARCTWRRVWSTAVDLDFDVRVRLLLVGVALYVVYIVSIGGDFMAGRHWSAPFFLTVALLATWLGRCSAAVQTSLLSKGFVACLVLHFCVQGLVAERNNVYEREQGRLAMVRHGQIRVQRFNCGFYEALFGAIGPVSQHSWSQDGLRARAKAKKFHEEHPDENYVVKESAAGKMPFYAGPGVTVIDALGITDPLLARTPDSDGEVRIIGHLRREVPEGYPEARRNGDTSQMEPHLRNYYEALREVISGPLFSWQRLEKVVAFQLGKYDEELRLAARHLKSAETTSEDF